ncbi:DUF488 family protein [Candidatus Magnetobacterium casense]|uniref:DUF488 family protein n=1 Tax=Candidatus Magnetobacterium casense TaxID=1455061 RepID=A0ABS6S2X4_9BACT|nr:DUF488 family protein [Candidatus Magnetobacterium casensis]
MQRLAAQALVSDVFLLCEERTPEHCHRRIIADECRRIEPRLAVTALCLEALSGSERGLLEEYVESQDCIDATYNSLENGCLRRPWL